MLIFHFQFANKKRGRNPSAYDTSLKDLLYADGFLRFSAIISGKQINIRLDFFSDTMYIQLIIVEPNKERNSMKFVVLIMSINKYTHVYPLSADELGIHAYESGLGFNVTIKRGRKIKQI